MDAREHGNGGPRSRGGPGELPEEREECGGRQTGEE